MALLKKAGAIVLILFCGITLVFCVISLLSGIGAFFASQQNAFDGGYLFGTILGFGLFGFAAYKLMRYGIKVLNLGVITKEESSTDNELKKKETE